MEEWCSLACSLTQSPHTPPVCITVHSYTKSSRQLKAAETGRQSFPEKTTPTDYSIPMVNPQNIHTSNTIHPEQSAFMNFGIYMNRINLKRGSHKFEREQGGAYRWGGLEGKRERGHDITIFYRSIFCYKAQRGGAMLGISAESWGCRLVVRALPSV